MPKKFQGENSKAVTARARKAEAKAVADARKKQQEEDALWEETDKHVLKKEQRKVRKAPFYCRGGVHTSGSGFKICAFVLLLVEMSHGEPAAHEMYQFKIRNIYPVGLGPLPET